MIPVKALVVYGSKRGGTAGLAGMIGEAFRAERWTAEVRDAASPESISDADIVVVGGALYMNRWHRDAREFVRRNRAGLRQVPVWLFSSGPLDASARSGDLAPVAQVLALAASVEARGHMTFGGRLEPGARGLLARSMAKRMAGDWRDRAHVAEWVHQIVHEFVPAEIVLPDVAAARAEQVQIPAQRRGLRTPAAT